MIAGHPTVNYPSKQQTRSTKDRENVATEMIDSIFDTVAPVLGRSLVSLMESIIDGAHH
jgi:hypothetical protein